MNPSKLRKERPLAALNRSRWESMLANPSGYHYLKSASGKSTQKRFLVDVAKFMDCLVSDLCYVSLKVGSAHKEGFALRSWETIAKRSGLEVWRVKQCFGYAKDRGWVTSIQPREYNAITDEVYGLVSIKRVTKQYFQDLGLIDALANATEAAKKTLKKLSMKLGIHKRYLLTPYSLLKKLRAKHSRPVKRPKYNPYASFKDEGLDIPF